MHYILGDILNINQKLPDNVRISPHIHMLSPDNVFMVTYRVDMGDPLKALQNAIEIMLWSIEKKAILLRVNDRDIYNVLTRYGGICVHYDEELIPSQDWWTLPNYIR